MSGPRDLQERHAERPDHGARRWPRLLIDSQFGRYMAGNVITMLGIWIYNIVAVVVAYDATGSALVAGAVTAAQFVPQILVAPLAGAVADRWNRKLQAGIGHVIAAGGSGGLAVWAWSVELDERAAVPLVVASTVVGIGNSIAGPAMLALVPALVRRAELPTAVALGMVPLPIGRALGPIIGTTIAVSASPAVAFAVTSATSLCFVLLVAGLHPRRATHDGDDGDDAPRSAWQYLRAHRGVAVLLLCVAAVGAGTDPSITLAPPLSAGLGRGSSLAGPVATSFGVGAGLGFALIPWARQLLGVGRHGYAGLLLMAVGMAVPAVAPTVLLSLVGFVLAGAGLTLAMTGLSATLQTALPDRMRGRLMALWSVAFAGTRPLAAVANGAVADALGYRAALGGMVVLLVLAAWVGFRQGEGAHPRTPGVARSR